MADIPSKLLKSINYLICLSFTIFLLKSCEKATAPFNPSMVSLKPEYVGVTDTDLRLNIKNLELPVEFRLYRDDSLVVQGQLNTSDTLLMDTLLLPAHSYRYQAILLKETNRISQSEEADITTMDTTSHEFQWEVYTIESPYGSGVLYDVAIIDENNIWAVGEVYADSAQPWLPYNAVHWDGSDWSVRRITVRFRNSDITPPGEGIFQFSGDDIWVTLGGAPAHWNGQNWTLYHLWDMGILSQDDGGVTKVWGSTPQNIYFVGRGGTIVHYNGISWQKLESGTDLPFQDIWGVVDWKTGKENILAVACNLFSNDGIAVMQITENSVSQISITNLPINISGVWSWKGREWYICGSGLYRTRTLETVWKQASGLPSVFQQNIRGQGSNDIFIVGHFGLVLHWNGYTWRRYSGLTVIYDGLAIKDDLVVAVGSKINGIVATDGIIMVGRRI